MSVAGLCEVCEAAEAQYGCDSCGALVCARHYEKSRGLCVQCSRVGGGRRL